MKIRKKKAYRNPRHYLTAEDRAWLEMVPVGREFGSNDYERLTTLEALVDTLQAVANRTAESIDRTIQFVEDSNNRIHEMENRK